MSEERARREEMTDRELLMDAHEKLDRLFLVVHDLASETLALHQSYKAARDAVSGLGDRVGRVERRTSSSQSMPAVIPPDEGNGAPQ